MKNAHHDVHERARQLIAVAGPEALSAADPPSGEQSTNAWLSAHLAACASCRAFAENVAHTIHSLRAIPIAAGRSLVSTTQLRVRQRALELQRQRERLWLVSVCCAAVTFCALLGTVALWWGFAWLGARAQLAASVWQAGFLVFCLMPALVAALLLLAKDKHLADRTDSYRG
jgi:predicted anti-sigma-YlaC factor YlaD